MAGRFASVVTTLALDPTPRPYTGLTEYCTLCGACVRRCPGDAISLEKGKSHDLCATYLKKVTSPDRAFYGCGQCQCNVPCEAANPSL
jgi:epoxyqueuosine reductase QueG